MAGSFWGSYEKHPTGLGGGKIEGKVLLKGDLLTVRGLGREGDAETARDKARRGFPRVHLPWRGFEWLSQRGKGRGWAGSCRAGIPRWGRGEPRWAAVRVAVHKRSGLSARPRSPRGGPVVFRGWKTNRCWLNFTFFHFPLKETLLGSEQMREGGRKGEGFFFLKDPLRLKGGRKEEDHPLQQGVKAKK